MKTLKQIIGYIIWIALALLLGLAHMRIVLGAKDEELSGFWGWLSHFIYDLALFQIGLKVGCVIAFLFVLFDFFYLKKKLRKTKKSIPIRFVFLLIISVFVGVAHYVLEKVIDVI